MKDKRQVFYKQMKAFNKAINKMKIAQEKKPKANKEKKEDIKTK